MSSLITAMVRESLGRRGVLQVDWAALRDGTPQTVAGTPTNAAMDLAVGLGGAVAVAFPPNRVPVSVEAELCAVYAKAVELEAAMARLGAEMLAAEEPPSGNDESPSGNDEAGGEGAAEGARAVLRLPDGEQRVFQVDDATWDKIVAGHITGVSIPGGLVEVAHPDAPEDIQALNERMASQNGRV